MREYRDMPPRPKKKEKDLLAKAGCDRADEMVLHESAALADQLRFTSQEIDDLKKMSSDREIAHSALLKARKPDRYEYNDAALEAHINQIVSMFTTASPLLSERLSPALVSDNPKASRNQCGFPDKDAQKRDRKFLFITHLHNESEEQGKQITSFFVRQSVYFAFFGKPADLGTDGSSNLTPPPSDSTPGLGMDGIQRLDQQRLEREELQQQELQRQEQAKLKQERLELERLEQARLEQERLKQEKARLEQERLQQERLQQEKARLEQERLEQERLEQARLEKERLEQARLEQERLEEEKLEQERLEPERLEQARLEQERLKHEKLEQERQEQERLKKERLEKERLEKERLEKERLEQEKLEQRREQERLEQRREQEMLEQERLEQERREQERLELRRIEEGVEQEELQERLAEALQEQEKLEQEKQRQQKHEKQEQERGEEERRRQETREHVRREQEKALKDSKGTRKRHTQIDMESLVSDHNTGQETLLLLGSTPLAQETPHSIHITYMVKERGVWRTSHSLDVDPSDPSKIERVAVKYMRKKIRLFDTKLNILTPADCFEAATADRSNTIFLIPEAEIDIDEELETSISELASKGDSIPGDSSPKRVHR